MPPSLNKTSELAQEISSSGEEQFSGPGQINSAMGQISQISRLNPYTSPELAATAEKISAQAEQVHRAMTFHSGSGRCITGAEYEE